MPTLEDNTMDDFDSDFAFDHDDINEDGREWADSDRGEDSWLDGSYEDDEADDDPATCEHPDPLEGFGMESDMTFW